MFYFEIRGVDDVESAVGPFVIEAVDVAHALVLLGLNTAASVVDAAEPFAPILVSVAGEPCEVARLPVDAGMLKPRQALSEGQDFAMHFIDHPELNYGNGVVARMIWWPCNVSRDVYPFADPLLAGEPVLAEPIAAVALAG